MLVPTFLCESQRLYRYSNLTFYLRPPRHIYLGFPSSHTALHRIAALHHELLRVHDKAQSRSKPQPLALTGKCLDIRRTATPALSIPCGHSVLYST